MLNIFHRTKSESSQSRISSRVEVLVHVCTIIKLRFGKSEVQNILKHNQVVISLLLVEKNKIVTLASCCAVLSEMSGLFMYDMRAASSFLLNLSDDSTWKEVNFSKTRPGMGKSPDSLWLVNDPLGHVYV